eukprot:271934-Prorocentrum_minimum.AAC.3
MPPSPAPPATDDRKLTAGSLDRRADAAPGDAHQPRQLDAAGGPCGAGGAGHVLPNVDGELAPDPRGGAVAGHSELRPHPHHPLPRGAPF